MKTYSKPLVVLCASVVIGTSLPLVLFMINTRRSQEKNGFVRRFETKNFILSVSMVLDLGFDGYYIAGNTNKNLFLSHREAPAHILMADIDLRDTTHFNLKFQVSTKYPRFNAARLKVYIDSPAIYMHDGPAGIVLRGSLISDNFKVTAYDGFSFDDFYGISKNSTLFKTLQLERSETKLTLKNRHKQVSPTFTFKRQVDGIFCCDGMLHIDRDREQIIHVFYYRNQIISLDTLLRERYVSKTIDTISKAQIELVHINSGRERTFGNPPTKVNRRSCVFGSKLYVNSSVKADNESWDSFANNSVIDVYTTEKGIYQYSFYIPKYQNRPLRYFQIVDHTVFALYQNHLVTYRLKP